VKKLTLLAVAGAGYVLGSRAGRERYEQIKTQANKAWNSPTVQDAAETVQTQAKQAGADLGHAVKDKVSEKGSSSPDPSVEQPSTIAPGQGTS
jgi:hypothetical protein